MRNRFFAAATARLVSGYVDRNREQLSNSLRLATLGLLHMSSLALLCYWLRPSPNEQQSPERSYYLYRYGWVHPTQNESRGSAVTFRR